MTDSNNSKAIYLALAGLLLVAAGLRLYTLGSADIVQDEYFTALYYDTRAHYTFNSLIYRLIELSQGILGESEFALRLPSFILGVASIYLVYVLGRQLFSPSVGLLAAAILTFFPWHIWHSQYARYYAAVIFFVALMHVFFVRSLRKDSIFFLVLAGIAAVLAVDSHITAVMAPACCWVVCVVCYFWPTRLGPRFSQRIVKIGFWIGIACAVVAALLLLRVLINWSSGEQGWIKYPAQLVYQYYRLAGAMLAATLLAVWMLERSRDRFASTYLGLGALLPLAIVFIAAFFMNIRADYAIYILIPASVATAAGVVTVWRQQDFGREAAILIFLLLLVETMPKLLSHYTDRLANYQRAAAEFLADQYREGDRVAVFVTGTHYYLGKKIDNIERDGLGNPHSRARPWPLVDLAPSEGRLWIAFKVTRDDVAPDTRKWLRQNNAIFVWRKVPLRFDSEVRGVEIFLVCAPSFENCRPDESVNP
jgi:4-amino-4-deoxy-L-arabinose transferase-like glycosyltransferase